MRFFFLLCSIYTWQGRHANRHMHILLKFDHTSKPTINHNGMIEFEIFVRDVCIKVMSVMIENMTCTVKFAKATLF